MLFHFLVNLDIWSYHKMMCGCVCGCAQLLSHVWLFVTPWTGLLCLWNFPGKNIEVAYHFLLQGIFLTQESNPCLWSLLCWQAVFITEPPGKPQYKMITNALYISASYILLNIIFPETNILLRWICVLPFPYSSHLVLDDMTTNYVFVGITVLFM